MAGQAWFRNPLTYIRECAQEMVTLYAWDRGFAHKNRLDPQKQIELNVPNALQYRLLMVGEQGTSELRRGHTLQNPYAVYPTWEYGLHTFDELEEMLANPGGWGQGNPPHEQPVPGQEHRVVITRYPPAGTALGKGFVRALAKLQKEYPECIIHLHGCYSYRIAFGMGFGAADVEVRTEAAQGKIMLPNGRKINYQRAPDWNQWISLMGFTIADMAVPRNRCRFNIKSAIWAAENWGEDVAFRVKRGGLIEPDAIEHKPVQVKNPVRGKVSPGDKLVCNACSLAPTCKYFRDGGVCTLPDSEFSPLAKLFGTRDSEDIIEGYSRFLMIQADRAKTAVELENIEGKLISEATKIINSVMTHAPKLAKLVNPELARAGAPQVNVNIGIGEGTNDMRAIVAGIFKQLQAEGMKREDITPEHVARKIAEMSHPTPKAIEAGIHDDD